MKKITMIVLCLIVLVMSVSFSGCGSVNSTEKEKAAVCFVLANTANSQGLNLNSPLVQDTIYSTIKDYGFISVVNCDGKPSTVFTNSFDIDDKYKNASKERLEMDARSKATSLITGMQGIIATDPEVDYLQALHLAVRSMASLEGYTSRSIVVLGTGLSTTGVLDFQNNLISADPATVVDLLEKKREIPNFSDITVYWQQLGDVAAPQEPLTSAQRIKLQEIYGGIVEAGGGIFVYNEMVALPKNENASYPAVTPIDLPADSPISFAPEVLSSNLISNPIILNEEQIKFNPDTDKFLYPNEVESVLMPIADFLKKNDVTILLCGTTAGDSNTEFSIDLSTDRAKAVRRTLIDLGVDPDRIIAVGLGSTDPWHIYGVGYDGEAASCNRKVVLLNASSKTAQEILSINLE